MQVACPPALDVFLRQEAWLCNQAFNRAEELTVEMRDIVKKMGYQSPYVFLGFYIFLSAMLAIPVCKMGTTIKADFLLSFF